jgi:hypothetical protein
MKDALGACVTIYRIPRLTISLLLLGSIVLPGNPSLQSQPPGAKSSYLSYEGALPILTALEQIVPDELRASGGADPAAAWSKWTAQRDGEIRTRLIRGDEDTIINFMLFGTSFTSRPRVTLDALANAKQNTGSQSGTRFVDLIRARAADLVEGIRTPGNNERLLFARHVAESQGYDTKTEASCTRLKQHLMERLEHFLMEQATYAKLLESARSLGDSSEEFAERSKLFRNRGLSLDTSLMPNFAIDQALASLKAKSLLRLASVRRVAIVGPGLDFVDKQEGFDFYPQQTIQPFAAIDSLLRLGLSGLKDLTVTSLDLSPRINDHLNRARARASRGISYVVQLPRDEQWKADPMAYWSEFGKQIGTPVKPITPPPALANLKVRAVSIRPAVVSLIRSFDLDIVLQHLKMSEDGGFDLIIATNILVYYDTFEQSLALANIEKMLRPGGLLLSNNALLELPGSRIHSIGYNTAVYSDRPSDGDHIVWYQRAPEK